MRAFLFFLLLAGVLHAQDFTVDSPYTAKKRRIKFSPHNHTQLNKKDTHSNRPPAQRLTELRDLGGFHAVAITDHNRITIPENTPPHLPQWGVKDLLFVPGNESSSFKNWKWHFSGELNLTGVSTEHTDPDQIRTFKHNRWGNRVSPEQLIADLVREGVFVILCHPNANVHTRGWKGSGYTYDELDRIIGNPQKGYKPFPVQPYGMEVGNQNYDLYPRGNFRNAEAKWDYVLTRGYRYWGTASDDSHNEPRLAGWCSVYLDELTLPELMNNLKKGNFYASQGPEFKKIACDNKQFAIETYKPCRIEFIGANGQVLKAGRNVTKLAYTFSGFEKYVRVRISRHCPEVLPTYSGLPSMRSAWTQPVFIRRKNAFPAQKIVLAENGKTDYKIVLSTKGNEIDAFAAKELAEGLKKMTGADFTDAKAKKNIFIGISPKGVKWDLSDQASIIHVAENGDIYLYGDKLFGAAYAVYDLLEKHFGCLWLSGWGYSYYPEKKKLELASEVFVTRPAFEVRSLVLFFYADKEKASLYAFRNKQNNELYVRTKNKALRNYGNFRNLGGHNLSIVLPPGKHPGLPKNFNLKLPPGYKPECTDYFTAHPEFFSLDEKGKRVPNRQLCFSNKELRKVFTRNLMMLAESQKKRYQKNIIISVGLNDVMQNMCYCKGCQDLQKKYRTPGGPLFDYMLELCPKYPDETFIISAYQRSQTQKPPYGIKRMPENLIITYCPIGGDYIDHLLGANNRPEMLDFYNWCQLSDRVWVWYYPNPYQNKLLDERFLIAPPVGNLDRIASDIRFMYKFGATGTMFEHDSCGTYQGGNFSELQAWVMHKLFENPEREVSDLVKQFTDAFYGPAAKLMREFLNDLETERKKIISSGGRWWMYDGHYRYLTPRNLNRWSELFDKAEKLTTGTHNLHVRLARLGLDCAIVELMEPEEPARKGAPARLTRTINEVQKVRPIVFAPISQKLPAYLKSKEGVRINKNLPGHLRKLDPARLQVLAPVINDGNKKALVKDEISFTGKAVTESVDGKSFTFRITDKENPATDVKLVISQKNLHGADYRCIHFPKLVKLTPSTILYGPDRKILFNLGSVTNFDDASGRNINWRVNISLRSIKTKKGIQVFCDRVILQKMK